MFEAEGVSHGWLLWAAWGKVFRIGHMGSQGTMDVVHHDIAMFAQVLRFRVRGNPN